MRLSRPLGVPSLWVQISRYIFMQCESGCRWSVGIRNEITHLIKINCSVSQELSVSHYLPHTTNVMAPHPHTALYTLTHAPKRRVPCVRTWMHAHVKRESLLVSDESKLKPKIKAMTFAVTSRWIAVFLFGWIPPAKRKNCSAFRINAHQWLITFEKKIKKAFGFYYSLKCAYISDTAALSRLMHVNWVMSFRLVVADYSLENVMSGCGLRGKLGYQTLACFSSPHSPWCVLPWCVLPWYHCGTIQGNVQPSKGDTRFVGGKVNRSNRSGSAALIRALRRKSVGTFAFTVYLSYAPKVDFGVSSEFFPCPSLHAAELNCWLTGRSHPLRHQGALCSRWVG